MLAQCLICSVSKMGRMIVRVLCILRPIEDKEIAEDLNAVALMRRLLVQS